MQDKASELLVCQGIFFSKLNAGVFGEEHCLENLQECLAISAGFCNIKIHITRKLELVNCISIQASISSMQKHSFSRETKRR